MASSTSVLSQTLQSITITKIRELTKQRHAYETRKSKALNAADDGTKDARARVTGLWDAVNDLDIWSMDELENMRRWIDQAEHDPSIGESTISKFEATLRSRLDIESRKLSLADLYSRLLTEWMDSTGHDEQESGTMESTSLEEPFEMVQTRQKERLEQLREKFERVVFEEHHTDEVEIDQYLLALFRGDAAEKALQYLRDRVGSFGIEMLAHKRPMQVASLKSCIRGLLKNDLLNDEKKASLRDFLRDEAVLAEIRDVLNMRYHDILNWSWNLGREGMPVIPRQSLNGKWRVMMDEDVLDALFTHWIGMEWAVSLKNVLDEVTMHAGFWKSANELTPEEVQESDYYKFPRERNSVDKERQKEYGKHFFMAPLPSELPQSGDPYDDDYSEPGTSPEKKSPKEIKQLLLRTIATEVIVRRSLDGEVAVVQSDFQWFATSVAHSTIFAVLRFMGFQEEWINFFKKVLEPPLDMLNGKPVRTRKRGLPMAQIFGKLFGELVLFFMDLTVDQEARMLLYRFHDDLWLVGKPQKCAKAWESMTTFAKVMGLEFNKHKTGSVYLLEGDKTRDPNTAKALPEGPVVINFLVLDPNSGDWTINKEHVQQHVEQLRKQLAGSKSVLEWIKTWNSCIGRFFMYTFGDPANCFGRPHLDSILTMHKEMQNFLFSSEGISSTVIDHVKSLITRRFEVTEVPDAFLYMPERLGGLNLQNPFVTLFHDRENLCKDPESLIQRFYEEEKHAYDQARKDFEALSKHDLNKRYQKFFPKESEYDGADERTLSWADAQEFPTFEEYTRWRESASPHLYKTYCELMERPRQRGINLSPVVERELGAAGMKSWGFDGLSADAKWTIQFHIDELLEQFDGLCLLDKSLLPLCVLQDMQSKKVTWQMVL